MMNVDYDGTFLLSFLIAVVAGAVIGGLIGGVSAESKGDSFWSGALSGALVGAALGSTLIFGGATMLAVAGKTVGGFFVASTFVAKGLLLAGTVTVSVVGSFAAGMGAYLLQVVKYTIQESLKFTIFRFIISSMIQTPWRLFLK